MEKVTRVLVTGGSGFIGTNLVRKLIDLKYDVISLDVTEPKDYNLNKYHIECDIRCKKKLKKVFLDYEPDFVIHLAARTDLKGKTIDDYSSNTIGVRNLCECIVETDSVIKTVFASSMLVCHRGYTPKSNIDYNPDTVYGESKVITENIISEYSSKLQCYTIIRPTSIWGPWFGSPYKDFFDIVLSNKYFHINGINTLKTCGYIGNSVNQIVSIMNHLELPVDQVIYIGDSEPINIREWATMICYESGNRNPISVPYLVFYSAAILGDIVSKVGISFPMTSFRLKNMINDNVQDCRIADSINKFDKVDTKKGIQETLEWLKSRG